MSKQKWEALEGMNEEQFLGKPKITKAANAASLVPGLLLSHADCQRVPFLDPWSYKRCMDSRPFTAVYSPDGAAVLLGDMVVASYHFGDHLVVDKKFRREGIGEELVYQFRTRFPEVPPAKSRTKASHALQKKVWSRIRMDLKKIEWAREAAAEAALEAPTDAKRPGL